MVNTKLRCFIPITIFICNKLQILVPKIIIGSAVIKKNAHLFGISNEITYINNELRLSVCRQKRMSVKEMQN